MALLLTVSPRAVLSLSLSLSLYPGVAATHTRIVRAQLSTSVCGIALGNPSNGQQKRFTRATPTLCSAASLSTRPAVVFSHWNHKQSVKMCLSIHPSIHPSIHQALQEAACEPYPILQREERDPCSKRAFAAATKPLQADLKLLIVILQGAGVVEIHIVHSNGAARKQLVGFSFIS